MKLVIEIPDHIYEHAKNVSEDSYDEWDAMRAIAKGFPYEERPHGEWIPFEWDDKYSTKIPLPKGSDSHMEEYWDEEFICSVCGKAHHARDFCPNCGANMRGDEEC